MRLLLLPVALFAILLAGCAATVDYTAQARVVGYSSPEWNDYIAVQVASGAYRGGVLMGQPDGLSAGGWWYRVGERVTVVFECNPSPRTPAGLNDNCVLDSVSPSARDEE